MKLVGDPNKSGGAKFHEKNQQDGCFFGPKTTEFKYYSIFIKQAILLFTYNSVLFPMRVVKEREMRLSKHRIGFERVNSK